MAVQLKELQGPRFLAVTLVLEGSEVVAVELDLISKAALALYEKAFERCTRVGRRPSTWWSWPTARAKRSTSSASGEVRSEESGGRTSPPTTPSRNRVCLRQVRRCGPWALDRRWSRCVCRSVSWRSGLGWVSAGPTCATRGGQAAAGGGGAGAAAVANLVAGEGCHGRLGCRLSRQVTSKGINNKESKSYLHSKTRDGKEVCYSWNDEQGRCADVAPGKSCRRARRRSARSASASSTVGKVPAVGLGSAVKPTGVQGDGPPHILSNLHLETHDGMGLGQLDGVQRSRCRGSGQLCSSGKTTY